MYTKRDLSLVVVHVSHLCSSIIWARSSAYLKQFLEQNHIFSEGWNIFSSLPQELSVINVLEWLLELNGKNLKLF